ncbi:MAG: Hsp20/alpha crystallin family protein, partial [Nocardioidaceae bacterium]
DDDGDDSTLYYTKERSWGRFRRTVTLPENVDEDDISADLADGILEVVIGQAASKASAGPARITVNTRPKPDKS